MRVYLNPTKLLQEEEIVQSEFERIKSLPSKWYSPLVPCIPRALLITICTTTSIGPFALFPHIVILFGVLILALEGRITRFFGSSK